MVNNPHFYGQSTHGTPNQIEDGVDFPHTGIIKALSDGLGQNYAISGFNITIDSSTQIDVGAGVLFRDGEILAVAGVNNLTLSASYTNGYHLLVADNHATAPVLEIKNPIAANKVAEYSAGDTIIAVITHNGTANVGIQYLTVDKDKNSLSLARSNGGIYTEMGTITADADSIDIVTTNSNADINITPNGNGKIVLDGLNWPIADGSANQFLKTNGSNQLSFAAVDLAPLIAHTDIPDSDTGFVKRTGSETYDIDTNTYLTAETDTLQSVTNRSPVTTTDITCGSIISNVNQNISYEVVNASSPIITGTKSVAYIHDISGTGNTVALPAPASGNILHIVNFFTNTVTITGNPLINQANTTHPKITSANVITLEPFEHVTLQGVNDGTAPLTLGHMIISDGDKDRSSAYATAAQGAIANTNATAITAINTKAHMFMYLLSDMTNLTSSTAQHILYDGTEYDVGSNYNATKDAFVAPRDGYYLVDVGFYLNSVPTWSFSIIQKSTDGGGTFNTALRNVSGSGQQNKLFGILKLDANDEIRHQAIANFSSGNFNVEGSLRNGFPVGVTGYANPTLTYFRVSEVV